MTEKRDRFLAVYWSRITDGEKYPVSDCLLGSIFMTEKRDQILTESSPCANWEVCFD